MRRLAARLPEPLRRPLRRLRDMFREAPPGPILPVDWEDLAAGTCTLFDPAQTDVIDDPALTVVPEIVTDILGRQRFDRRYIERPAAHGAPQLPPLVEIDGGAVVLAATGWIVTREGWLKSMSIWRGHSFVPEAVNISAPMPIKVEGRQSLSGVTLNCISDWTPDVYGHCLWESVWRILRFFELRGSFDGVDHVLAPAMAQRLLDRFDPELRAALGGRLVAPAGPAVAVVCEGLLAIPQPIAFRGIGRDQVALLRRHARLAPTAGGRRLFLDRPLPPRNIVNRDEVLEAVRQAGLEVVQAGEMPNVFEAFHAADLVVGLHGSDLADIVFMRPGTKVLELSPTDHIYPYYRLAAEAAELMHHTLFVPSRRHRLRRQGTNPHDVRVDPAELTRALAILG